MSKVSLGHLDAPCILYDLDGYYAGLKALLAHMVEMGLSSPERQSGIYFVKNLDEIKSILKGHKKSAGSGVKASSAFCCLLTWR